MMIAVILITYQKAIKVRHAPLQMFSLYYKMMELCKKTSFTTCGDFLLRDVLSDTNGVY